jgi:hypothetical protein
VRLCSRLLRQGTAGAALIIMFQFSCVDVTYLQVSI